VKDPREIPSSPMQGRYLIRNRKWNLLFRVVDFALEKCLREGERRGIREPGKLLLANGAHLGDVIISTSMLPVIKSAFPDVEIGFLTGSWSAAVVTDHPLVDRVHIIDHWWHSRSSRGWGGKAVRYLRTRSRALREIRSVGYDVAIDLYSFFPNMIPVLWQAGIPIRIGYVSGGFGPMLTHQVFFYQDGRHESEYQADLLQQLPIDDKHFEKQRSTLTPATDGAVAEVRGLLSVDSLEGYPYRVLHMGSSGSPLREWPLRSWRIMAERLLSDGHTLVFTGIGDLEKRNIEAVIEGKTRCIDACGTLRWEGFVEILRHAEIVYSIETSAGHIAAAAETPCVSIYGAVHDVNRWRPRGKYSELVTNPVPCAPCFLKHGCEGMECIRDVPPDRVYEAGEKLLAMARKEKK